MPKLIYSAITSLDGYIADKNGKFDWAAPSEDVHAFVNDLERQTGTYLFGRRMYEVMVAWETIQTEDEPDVIRDFAELWRAADKVVYSTSLTSVASAKTRIERSFDADDVRRMKAMATRDVSVGGAGLAGQVIKVGLVDEYRLFVKPVIVGGGTRSLPDDVRIGLTLLGERRFGDGTVYLRYGLTTK